MHSLKLLAVMLIAAAQMVTGQDCTTWYETTQHGPGFRNVSAYGATGNGITDDTAAIIQALTAGRSPAFSTVDPTIVYFPPGTYLVSQTLPVYFYTFIVGNYKCRPTITLKSGAMAVNGGFVIDSDVGDESSEHTDEFYRGIMHINLVIQPNNMQATGIHWAQSQATQIRDVFIDMGDGASAIFGENGSGGFIGDVVVVGGRFGICFGNQQWTWRNVSVSGATTACFQLFWDWAMVFENIQVSNCPLGMMFTGTASGSLSILDSTFTNVTLGISTDFPSTQTELLLERFTATEVNMITTGLPGNPAGSLTIPSWRQGVVFGANTTAQPGLTGTLPLTRPDSPLEQRSRPTFDGINFVNVYSTGAFGDGVHDDTVAIQTAINSNAAVFFPQGTYLVSAPILLKSNSILVGEALSAIAAIGGSEAWADPNQPQPMISIPQDSEATVMIADMLFTSTGNASGCILVAWGAGSGSSAWDVHWRQEFTSWGLLQITGGGYFENMWAWVADHDINTNANLNVYNPRGITVSPGAGPFWFYGVAAEHSYLWQFNLDGVETAYVLMAQTESPYWQSPPTAWGMTITNSTDVHVYGTGFYNWFNGIQEQLFNVQNSEVVLFDVNVHGCDTVIVGDYYIANNTIVENWFCDGFIALIPTL